MNQKEIKELLDSNCDVRSSVASNPNTSVDVLTVLSTDSVWNVRSSVASNPNTSVDVLTVLSTDSDCDVRSSVASNPNTSVDVLTVLSTDSVWNVRRRVASNPNTKDFQDIRKWIIGQNYIATQGTSHLWYKFKSNNEAFYVCGCFIGNRNQLIGRISYDDSCDFNERMRILDLLDNKFAETFNI